MTDEHSKIATVMRFAKKTLKISNQNVTFEIGVRVVVLIVSAIGITTMWAAIFGDVGLTVLAILNSFRALKLKTCSGMN